MLAAFLPILKAGLVFAMSAAAVVYIIWWAIVGRKRPTWRDQWHAFNQERGWEGGPFRRGEYPWSRGEWDGIPIEIEVYRNDEGMSEQTFQTAFQAGTCDLSGIGMSVVPRSLLNRLTHSRQVKTGNKTVDRGFIITPGKHPERTIAIFGHPTVQGALAAIQLERWSSRAPNAFLYDGLHITRRRVGSFKNPRKRLQVLEPIVRLAVAINNAVATSPETKHAGPLPRQPTWTSRKITAEPEYMLIQPEHPPHDR